VNFDTDVQGVITKRLGDANYEATPAAGSIKDLYEAVFVDGVRHLLRLREGNLEYSSGGGTFTSVTAGYSTFGNFEFASYLDRVYFGNGIDNPQVYDRTTSYGGVTYTAPKTKEMGAQAPTSAIIPAVAATGNVAPGTYIYKVTFLYYDFEESNGGPASGAVIPGVASQISLLSIPVGGYGVTARKIYRSSDGGVSYRLVQTINDNTTTTGTDNSASATTDMPVDNGGPRNFTLIVQSKDRNWVAGIPGDKSDLDYSAAGQPDIFPTTNTILCNPRDPITGLVVFNDRVVVFNRNSFGQILGTDPSSFRYSEMPGNIGCVDNRTIQVRVLHGVPVLVWLSDRGFYLFNGSTVEYISDDIENLVNFNIQQASQVKGSVAHSSQAVFQAGTYTGGIDLTSNPGAITTPNPKSRVDEQAEWEAGSALANIVTRDPSLLGQIAMQSRESAPILTIPLGPGSDLGLALGTGFSGFTSGAWQIPPGPSLGQPFLSTPFQFDYTGFNSGFNDGSGSSSLGNYLATRIVIPRAGTINTFNFRVRGVNIIGPNVLPVRAHVWSDAGSQPGSLLFTSATVSMTFNGTFQDLAMSGPFVLAAGNYWIGFSVDPPVGTYFQTLAFASTVAGGQSAAFGFRGSFDGSSWPVSVGGIMGAAIGFTQTAVPLVLGWTSEAIETFLFTGATSIDVRVNHLSSLPVGVALNTFIEQADDQAFTTGVVTSAPFSLLNGLSAPHTFAATKKWWRIRMAGTLADDRNQAKIISVPYLEFPDTATWVSATIDGTTDTSAMNSLEINVSALPANTSVTAYVQKSAASGSGFVDEITQALVAGANTISLTGMGNQTLRYSRIKLVFGNSLDPTASAAVSSAELKWTITARFYSPVVDTGNTPAGWDVFQASVTASGAGVTFGMRADAVSANLTDDLPAGPYVPAFTAVTNGVFPTGVTVAKFAQWTTTMTATADNVPIIDSVTLNWFISQVSSIRAASIFLNKSYYVSLAEYGSTTNNLLLKLDQSGHWRIFRDMSVGTLSFFFSDAYYGAADVAQVRKFLSGTTDHGIPISMDVRLKAFDFDDITRLKALRAVYVVLGNTGATYTVEYSVDNGVTFLPLVDSGGNTTFTVPNDGVGITTKRLAPLWPNQLSGKTQLVRITEATSAEAEIHEVHIDAYIRQGEILNG
jgi:hypothetical protein